MAIQVSINQKDGVRGNGGKDAKERGIGHGAATWAVAAIDLLGRGLAGLWERVRGFGDREGKRRQMQLVESLALGNRRQLLLVACGSHRYLVGAGADSVTSILAMEPGADLVESLGAGFPGPGSRTRGRPIGRMAKGPELVRHELRQITSERESEHDTRSGLWP